MVLAAVVLNLSILPAVDAAEKKMPVQLQQHKAQTAYNLFRAAKPTHLVKPADKKAGSPTKPSKQKKAGRRRSRTRRRGPAVAAADIAKFKDIVARFAGEFGVPADLAHAVVTVESNYYPKARGKDGEIGLMQIMPATARGMGYRGPMDGLYHPETNIKWGMRYLAKAYHLGGKTTCGAILKYNAGHGAKRMNPISSAYCAKVKRILGK